MADQIETLVTPEMIKRQGVWGHEETSFPISLSDIRKFAIAVYWPQTPPRLFWDEEYARTTRWGGIIAPQDFNPFAWPIKNEDPAERAPEEPPQGKARYERRSDRYVLPAHASGRRDSRPPPLARLE